MTLKVLVADDHRIMREGLIAILRRESDIKVIAEANDGQEAVKLALDMQPDIVLMDIAMPTLNGEEATRRILAKSGKIRIIALSMHSDKVFISRLIKAGVAGYLVKDCASEELLRAIRTVVLGQVYLSPRVAGSVIDDYRSNRRIEDFQDLSNLSSREKEILQLLAEGDRPSEIAEKLHISVRTVETHRDHIMSKLDIHNLAGLVKFAIREGITSSDG